MTALQVIRLAFRAHLTNYQKRLPYLFKEITTNK